MITCREVGGIGFPGAEPLSSLGGPSSAAGGIAAARIDGRRRAPSFFGPAKGLPSIHRNDSETRLRQRGETWWDEGKPLPCCWKRRARKRPVVADRGTLVLSESWGLTREGGPPRGAATTETQGAGREPAGPLIRFELAEDLRRGQSPVERANFSRTRRAHSTTALRGRFRPRKEILVLTVESWSSFAVVPLPATRFADLKATTREDQTWSTSFEAVCPCGP